MFEDPSLAKLLADERVISLKDAARIAGLSTPTLRRAIKRGKGPRVVRPSPRRIGVRIGDLRAWLEARARPDT